MGAATRDETVGAQHGRALRAQDESRRKIRRMKRECSFNSFQQLQRGEVQQSAHKCLEAGQNALKRLQGLQCPAITHEGK
eukprot:1354526-Pleurochrysis_carterae.AAC.3